MSRTPHRTLGLFWRISPEAPPDVVSLIWATCCDALEKPATTNGRRLVLPSVVTQAVPDAYGLFETRAVAVLVEPLSA